MQSSSSLKNFEYSNDIKSTDTIYKYDEESQKKMQYIDIFSVHHFKDVKISSKALIKMVSHAKSGGNIEIMGLMLGKVIGRTMVVIDSFSLPVEGTETRVNAQAEGYEYMVNYIDKIKQVGRQENAIGWYHSHPGYGCWLSGIDVNTQLTNQAYSEPFLAVVIDPIRTASAGKVEIGAFRTYPEAYKSSKDTNSGYQTIPQDKIEDFGVHAEKYYQLNISYFKSSCDAQIIDALWQKYWADILSQSDIHSNRDFRTSRIVDMQLKLEQINSTHVMRSTKDNSELTKISKDANKLASEALKDASSELFKNKLFAFFSV